MDWTSSEHWLDREKNGVCQHHLDFFFFFHGCRESQTFKMCATSDQQFMPSRAYLFSTRTKSATGASSYYYCQPPFSDLPSRFSHIPTPYWITCLRKCIRYLSVLGIVVLPHIKILFGSLPGRVAPSWANHRRDAGSCITKDAVCLNQHLQGGSNVR